jgi:two-component system, LytTR family, response regulator
MKEKIKVTIIDDESLAREIVKSYLVESDNIEIIGECSNGFEGIKTINELNPDLIFLDIQMPKINGFEMLELIENPPTIIFTTAYDNYAIKAFEVNAVDYLLKPFSKERFDEALKKVLDKFEKKSGDQKTQIKSVIETHSSENNIERIIVKDGPEIFIIPVDDIIYFEAQDDYVMIHTNNRKYLKQQRMKYYENILPQKEFVRIHRSYIVSIKSIKKIELLEKESYEVLLHNGIKLPVSKNGYDKLRAIIN